MVVIWNPTVRKSVGIFIPKASNMRTIVGFGVCPDTSDPTLVKINLDKISNMWVVEVFVDGVIYFLAYDDVFLDGGVRSNFVISFDLKSEEFGEVCLPEMLLHTPDLNVTKVNESLGLLEYHYEGGMKFEGKWSDDWVLGFRNNGEVVMELDADNYKESRIAVYEPLSGHINDVGINGKLRFLDQAVGNAHEGGYWLVSCNSIKEMSNFGPIVFAHDGILVFAAV
ncbi:ribonuclease H-like domain-containing protein [Tanacetum coccineum]